MSSSFRFWAAWGLRWIVTGLLAWAAVVAGLLWLPGDPSALWLDQPQLAAQIRADWQQLVQPQAPLVTRVAGVVHWLSAGAPGTSWATGQPLGDLMRGALVQTGRLLLTILALGTLGGLALVLWRPRPGRLSRWRQRASLLLLTIPDVLLLFGLLLATGALGLSLVPSAADRLLGQAQPLAFWGPVAIFAIQVALVMEQQVAPAWERAMGAPLGPWLATRGWSTWRVRRLHLSTVSADIARTIRLTTPALAGSLVLIERVTQQPGLGGLGVASLVGRDLPVALLSSTWLIVVSWTVAAAASAWEHRSEPREVDAGSGEAAS